MSSSIKRQAEKRKHEPEAQALRASGIPAGWWPVEAWTNGTHVVVCGRPSLQEDLPEDQQHDCDQMGCGSFNHVIARCEIPAAIENPAIAEPTMWDEMMAAIAEDLHPTGHCSCCGEGTCEWCQRICRRCKGDGLEPEDVCGDGNSIAAGDSLRTAGELLSAEELDRLLGLAREGAFGCSRCGGVLWNLEVERLIVGCREALKLCAVGEARKP